MKSITSNLNDKELRQEIYKLRRDLREDLREVKEFSKAEVILPTYAVDHFKKAEKSMREKSVRSMDRKELESVYRQLHYIRGLKSSTVQGGLDAIATLESAKNRVAEIKDENLKYMLSKLDRTELDQFWKIYGKVFEGGDLAEQFKYEIWNTIIDYMEGGRFDEGTFAKKISDLYESVQIDANTGGFADDAEILFTQALRELFSND